MQFAFDSTTHRAYLSLAGTNQVAVVDTEAAQVVDWIPVTFAPWGIALDPIANRLWVGGDAGSPAGRPSLMAIDLATKATVFSLDAGHFDVAIDPAGRRVYSANGTGLKMLDADSGAQLATQVAAAGQWRGVAVDTTAHRVYVTDVGTKHVLVFSAADLTPLDSIALQGVGSGLAVDEAAQRLYLGTNPLGDNPLPPVVVHVIDTTTDDLITDVATPGFVDMVSLDPSGGVLYAMNKQFLAGAGIRGSVSSIDLSTLTITKTTNVGMQPSGAVAGADGTLFVANSQDGTISVIPPGCCDPILSGVDITPKAPHPSWNITANVSAGDQLAISYQWIKNGADLPGETSRWLSLNLLGVKPGDVITVRVVGFDGTNTTPPVMADPVIVSN